MSIYFYNVQDKKPLVNCKQNMWENIQVTDIDDKFIKNVSKRLSKEEQEQIQDFSTFHYEIEVDEKFKGGVYKLKSGYNNLGFVKFFIKEFDNREYAVVPDWNIETVKPGDQIQGKLHVKSFTRNQLPNQVTLSYNIVNGDGGVLTTV